MRRRKKCAISRLGLCGWHDHARSHPASAHLPTPRCILKAVRSRKLFLARYQLRVEEVGLLSTIRLIPLPILTHFSLFYLNTLVSNGLTRSPPSPTLASRMLFETLRDMTARMLFNVQRDRMKVNPPGKNSCIMNRFV
jgi:hypothetical protein